MPEYEIYSWLADENNNRAISSLGTIFQIFGIIIPAFVAIFIYIRTTLQRARDEVIEFINDWNSTERSKVRYTAMNIFRKLNTGEISFEEITTDDEKRVLFITFLNENEFLALFVLAAGPRSFRRKLAKRFFRAIIIDYWEATKNFILHLREETQNPELFVEFEVLAKIWKEESN